MKEKESITRELPKGMTTLKIAKVLHPDHWTINKYVTANQHGRKKRVQPKFRKLNDRQLRQIHRQVVKTPLTTSRQIFEACDMPNLSRATCCKALREVVTVQKPKRNPPLNQRHKSRRLEWAKN